METNIFPHTHMTLSIEPLLPDVVSNFLMEARDAFNAARLAPSTSMIRRTVS